MNRKKKINQTLIAKDKKKKAKLHGSNKPKYVSKADRERLAQLAVADGPELGSSDAVVSEHQPAN
ncbi:DUF2986 domain-containing protein [Shewanella amazonensis]|uniref:DUF2986 domain-containing protein n=1 Tax=Shewanella amazonensis (strain ATCC BAA-1098 / SB2B) TaxID=326297 RepID=A1S9N1_SHEAM|nr:DUF2986 domain-containing protein [Shewanella amazonensis]ABM01088.1 conserved hypothetical protein [Shewanella amazonensis SB2B]